jgi:hypothetical protein
MLGHASAAMTLDVYADLFDDDLDHVAEALNRSSTSSFSSVSNSSTTYVLPRLTSGAFPRCGSSWTTPPKYQIMSGFHGPTDVSPVGLAAQSHVGLAIHNFGIQEYMEHSERTNSVFEQTMTFIDGSLHPGEAPGLGVELNEEEAAAYPYQQAYLPYNRLADGTMHDW